MPNVQLMPRPRSRRVGLGDYPGFDSLISSVPQAKQAWQSKVANQLAAENALPGIYYTAQQNFLQAYNQISSPGVLGASDLDTISNAAAQLVFNNNTIAGAGQIAEGLVQGAIRGNPVEIMQALSGGFCALVATDIAAGTISFGVGALITVGIEALSAALEQLFQGPPAVATVCGTNLSYQPGIIVNCAWTQGVPDSVPGDAFWRRFPEPSNPNDAWWFDPEKKNIITGSTLASGSWTSGKSTDVWYAAAPNGIRPIDAAFPQYHQLECDVAVASPVAALPDSGGIPPQAVATGDYTIYSSDDVMFARFILAYFGAWKANAEYQLNGQASTNGWANDAALLTHVLKIWNNTHLPGSGKYNLSARNNDKSLPPTDVVTYPNPCTGNLSDEWWYVTMLLNNASIPTEYGGPNLVPNTGAKITPALASPPTSSTLGSVALGTAVATGVAAGSLAVYARVTRQSYTSVLKALWGSARGLL